MSIFTRAGRGTVAAQTHQDLIRHRESGRGPAQHTVIGHQPSAAGPSGPAAAARGPRQQAGVDRRYAVVMLAAAATFGLASYLHLDGRIPLGFTTVTGEHFSRASIPEAVIGAVLAAGAVVVAVASRRARAAALGAVGFAVLGVLAGLGFVLTSSRPHIAADLAYHLSVLAVLLAGLWALACAGRTGTAPTGSARPRRADHTDGRGGGRERVR